ncbi:Zinc finger protein 518B [Manis javanica]|nr:Zinc finger protein 518B [Manis javanica]
MHNIMLLPESKEYQKDVVCIPNKVTLLEPNEVSLFENKSVEVEVLSPAKEPVQPGMPLTVVAPAELVVPANCLAQLIDVKVVNGTQQLVLKLFPLEENNCLEAGGGDGGNSEYITKEKGSKEHGHMVSAEQTKSLMIEGNVGKFAGIGNLQSSIQKQLQNVKWVARQLRLIAAKPDQLIKCPRRNQPVIVLNHPDVDSPEVTNVMKEAALRTLLLPSIPTLSSLVLV